MAAQSTLKNMVLCLTLVCLICSAVLGVAYAVTKEPVEAAQAAKTANAIAKVLPEFGGDVTESSVNVDGVDYKYYTTSSGVAVISDVNGFGGVLSVMVGICPDGTLCNTSVISHSETPGLGAKCQNDEAFLAQFRGLDPAQKRLAVKKDGGDIDAITASTITSRAYTLAVVNALKVYRTLSAMPQAAENEGGEYNGQ